jgi:hypothetical protein
MKMIVTKTGRALRSTDKSQSLVEMALVLPVILILLIGVTEVGHALNSYITVVDAGRDAARLGSKGQASDTEIKNLVLKDTERLSGAVDPADDVTVEHNVMPGAESIKVSVCYDHSLILSLPDFLPDPIRMCSSTTMRAIVYED